MNAADIRDLNWQQLRERVSGLREDVYAGLQRHGPCTTRQLATKMGRDILGVRPRVTELVDLGFAECTGRLLGEGVYRALTYDQARAKLSERRALARGEGVQGSFFSITMNAPKSPLELAEMIIPPRMKDYALLLPTLQKVAREHGYALAVHGSMMRDLDLIAAPWMEEATDDETLARALCAAIGGKIYAAMHDGKTDKVEYNPVQRPHGRKGWVIHIGGGPYLDVAVMPRLQQ